MSNQTPREQLAKALRDNRGNTNDAIDAILAVFTGLPAMQKKPVSVRPDLLSDAEWYQWRGKNAKIDQILAELEGGHE